MIEPSTIICFQNARLIKKGKLSVDDLWIQDGKFINPEPFNSKKIKADIYIDCKKAIIAPGFIDLQINGGFGYDFSDPNSDIETAIKIVSNNLVQYGVTSFCPTLITQPTNNYKLLLPKIKRGPVPNGATILGVHLEGPFISKEKKGAHSVEFIQDQIVSLEQLEKYYHDLSNVSIITLAPELDRNNVLKELIDKNKGLVVSLGHSNANLNDSERAFKNGATMITHLFNAMPVFHHRDPGLLGLLTLDSDRQIYYGIIADGIHAHYSALRLAFLANRSGMVLVSDGTSATGLQTGIHKVGKEIIEIKDNRAFLAGTDTLCGSIATLDYCVKYLKEKINCSIVEAIECATLHPAQVLNLEKTKGTLNFDADADFVILNDSLQIIATFVAGKCVFVHKQNNNDQIDFNNLLK